MALRPNDEVLRSRSAFNPQLVLKRGGLVVREPTPWSASVHSLLRHLESLGIEAPRVAGTGYDEDGMETLTYVDGSVDDIALFSLDGARTLGSQLRRLHEVTASFPRHPGQQWFPWRGEELGNAAIIGHRDLGPWNIVRRGGQPIAFIDWTRAGPVDPLVELAQVCWLNAHLHDDVVAKAEGLPTVEERVKHLRAIVDGYDLQGAEREDLVAMMIELVVLSAADDADHAGVVKGMVSGEAPSELVWALTWQVRGAAWQIRNRRLLLDALL